MNSRVRLTLAGCLVLIAFFAIAFAALKSASLIWAQITFTCACATLLFTLVGSVAGGSKPIWIGAAIFGWGYAFLVFGPWCSEHTRPWLLSSRIMHEAFLALYSPPNAAAVGINYFPVATVVSFSALELQRQAQGMSTLQTQYFLFSRIGESLSVIVHVVQGAFVGWLIVRLRSPRHDV